LDGTAAGTRLLKAVDRPHPVLIGVSDSSPELTPVGSQLFFRADDGVHGLELWKTDGTPEGTVLVKDLAPGSHDSRLHGLTAAGGTLYFGATDEVHGYELWRSDGTAAGTTLVQDILPGPAPSNPDQLTAADDGTLYFTANDGEHGRELWALLLPR
jgi:ELWxxDGT repeat protein